MLYAILAYHVEADVMSWTTEEDAAVMTNLADCMGRTPCLKLECQRAARAEHEMVHILNCTNDKS